MKNVETTVILYEEEFEELCRKLEEQEIGYEILDRVKNDCIFVESGIMEITAKHLEKKVDISAYCYFINPPKKTIKLFEKPYNQEKIKIYYTQLIPSECRI